MSNIQCHWCRKQEGVGAGDPLNIGSGPKNYLCQWVLGTRCSEPSAKTIVCSGSGIAQNELAS